MVIVVCKKQETRNSSESDSKSDSWFQKKFCNSNYDLWDSLITHPMNYISINNTIFLSTTINTTTTSMHQLFYLIEPQHHLIESQHYLVEPQHYLAYKKRICVTDHKQINFRFAVFNERTAKLTIFALKLSHHCSQCSNAHFRLGYKIIAPVIE